MMAIQEDVKLTKVHNYYDISLTDGGDIETEDAFNTLIINSLFTEARANKTQIVVPERRRGWIGSHDSNYKLGSTIWVYGQLRNRNAELNELAGIAKLALKHIVDDGLAIHISSSVSVEDDAAVLNIRIERPNSKVDYRHYELWNNTGV